jgi:translation elongation factor EF-Ts
MNLKKSICEILSDKKAKREGLHVRHIALHIRNHNNTLFSDGNDIAFDILKRKVNRILANDVKKKRNNLFMKVINPKTNKFKKGYYKLKPSRLSATNLFHV